MAASVAGGRWVGCSGRGRASVGGRVAAVGLLGRTAVAGVGKLAAATAVVGKLAAATAVVGKLAAATAEGRLTAAAEGRLVTVEASRLRLVLLLLARHFCRLCHRVEA